MPSFSLSRLLPYVLLFVLFSYTLLKGDAETSYTFSALRHLASTDSANTHKVRVPDLEHGIKTLELPNEANTEAVDEAYVTSVRRSFAYWLPADAFNTSTISLFDRQRSPLPANPVPRVITRASITALEYLARGGAYVRFTWDRIR